tara:strand:- start:2246 stop:2827 length:582 start_codon:yes stop_codon:yes gene_type:complete
MRLNNYKTACKIEATVWRSSRLNDTKDELVVARGTYSDKPGYFMAWESKEERAETISWNGTVSWYPRMFWENIDGKNNILILDDPEFLEQRTPGQKSYWHNVNKSGGNVIEQDGQLYVKLSPFTFNLDGVLTYKANVKSDSLDAFSRAVTYVQWFNENNRQLTKYGKLLNSNKKARQRRKKRLEQKLRVRLGG